MKESVSSLMEIKGSKITTKKKAYKLKCSVAKFASDLVKLGE